MPFHTALCIMMMDVCTSWVEQLPDTDDRVTWNLRLIPQIMRTLEALNGRQVH